MRNLPCGALNSLHCPLPLDPRKFNFFWGEKESSAHNPSSGGVSPFWVPHIIPGQALFGFRKFRKFRTPSPPAPQPPRFAQPGLTPLLAIAGGPDMPD